MDILQCLFGNSVDTVKVREATSRIYDKVIDAIETAVGNISIMEYLNSEKEFRRDVSKQN